MAWNGLASTNGRLVVWDSWVPLSKITFHKDIPEIQTTGPQTTSLSIVDGRKYGGRLDGDESHGTKSKKSPAKQIPRSSWFQPLFNKSAKLDHFPRKDQTEVDITGVASQGFQVASKGWPW